MSWHTIALSRGVFYVETLYIQIKPLIHVTSMAQSGFNCILQFKLFYAALLIFF